MAHAIRVIQSASETSEFLTAMETVLRYVATLFEGSDTEARQSSLTNATLLFVCSEFEDDFLTRLVGAKGLATIKRKVDAIPVHPVTQEKQRTRRKSRNYM